MKYMQYLSPSLKNCIPIRMNLTETQTFRVQIQEFEFFLNQMNTEYLIFIQSDAKSETKSIRNVDICFLYVINTVKNKNKILIN